jgi:hypothetical protein
VFPNRSWYRSGYQIVPECWRRKNFNCWNIWFFIATACVLPREEILQKVWQYGSEVNSRTVDVHIVWLRQKVDQPQKSKAHPDRARSRLQIHFLVFRSLQRVPFRGPCYDWKSGRGNL